MSTQRNTRGEGTSIQNNPISEGDSSSSRARTLITLTSVGLEPFRTCSSFISESFKNEVDPNGINWKGVSNEIRNGYFGEFKDPSISESAVRRKWDVKAATRYRDFIARRNTSKVKPSYVPVNVWESWMQLWRDAKCVERSKINSKSCCGGGEVTAGTHTGGSITIEVHRKRLVEIQYQESYICTFIHMIMTKNLLLRSVPELSMKNMKKYCRKKHNLRQILINATHIMKLREEKGGKKYMILDLKQKVIIVQNFLPLRKLILHYQHHLQFLNQHH